LKLNIATHERFTINLWQNLLLEELKYLDKEQYYDKGKVLEIIYFVDFAHCHS